MTWVMQSARSLHREKAVSLKADGYEDLLSHEFTQSEWDVAHEIANDYEFDEAILELDGAE